MSRKSTGSTANQSIAYGSGSYFANQSAFTAIIWFRSPSNAAGNAVAVLFSNSEIFPSDCTLSMTTSGALNLFYRGATATTFNNSVSGGGFDDGAWHWVMIVRRSATDHQWYIDGTSIATSATDPGTLTLTAATVLGDSGLGMASGAQVGRFMVWRRALTILEGRRAAYLGMDKAGGPLGTVWCELGSPVIEPDLSGNKNFGTPGASSTIGESVPPRSDYWDIPKFRRPQLRAGAASTIFGSHYYRLVAGTGV